MKTSLIITISHLPETSPEDILEEVRRRLRGMVVVDLMLHYILPSAEETQSARSGQQSLLTGPGAPERPTGQPPHPCPANLDPTRVWSRGVAPPD